ALLELAKIVRAADTGKTDLAPESIGLEAMAAGSMMIAKNDHDAIEKQAYLYDALYAYCKLRMVRQKYASEIEKLDPKRKREFLKSKVREAVQ
ncbi:chromate resistance protein, partial [Candidatus Bathyarchaeota archaeon]|nr:chromate resistance protein [Candidatus Bathyarchaeota archaeon]